MLCRNCGAKVEDHSAFCRFCGQALTQPTYQQNQYQPNNQQNPYQLNDQQTYQPSQAYPPSYQSDSQYGYRPAQQQTYQPSQAYPPSYQPTYEPSGVYRPTYQPSQAYYTAPPAPARHTYSWSEFYDQFAAKKTKRMVTWEIVICFFTAAISLVFLALLQDMLGLMDIAVYLATGVLLLTQKKSIFALIPTIYGGVWTVIGMATEGSTTGVAAVAVGVVCMIALGKVEKAYKEYQATGTLPTEQL